MDQRLPLIHLKDYQMTAKNEPIHCEIGAGNLNMTGVIAVAEQIDCKWFIGEQDSCPGNLLESAAKSYDYITTHFCA